LHLASIASAICHAQSRNIGLCVVLANPVSSVDL
jgi:hypothetical protein